MRKISFIGVGNMGGAILKAVCAKNGAEGIYISNRTGAKADALAAELGCTVSMNNAACAENADYVFIGVKPNTVREVLREISACISGHTVIVSMAAGVDSGAIRAALGRGNPIVRILPNTPCSIGQGLLLIAPCGDVPPETLDELAALLAGCGRTAFTDEAHADAGMTIGGCTPAFTCLFIEALADGAVQTGLSRADALQWAAQAVAGSAALVLESGRHPGELKDAVCSPGGSTIEGVRVLENAGFRGAAMDAVIAAFEKSRRLLS